jgi:hypothetical protein
MAILVKYDCAYLRTNNLYYSPASSLVHWPNSDQTQALSYSSVTYTIGNAAVLIAHPPVHATKTYTYSCVVQYEIVCPSSNPNCSTWSSYFTTPTRSSPAMISSTMWSVQKLVTQLKVNSTTSNTLFTYYNGYTIQVNAYIFSTGTISTVEYNAASPPAQTPQYTGLGGYKASFSWTHTITIYKVAQCSFLTTPLAGWIARPGTTSITSADFAVRSDASKSYSVNHNKLTIDASLCALVSISELRLIDPTGATAD